MIFDLRGVERERCSALCPGLGPGRFFPGLPAARQALSFIGPLPNGVLFRRGHPSFNGVDSGDRLYYRPAREPAALGPSSLRTLTCPRAARTGGSPRPERGCSHTQRTHPRGRALSSGNQRPSESAVSGSIEIPPCAEPPSSGMRFVICPAPGSDITQQRPGRHRGEKVKNGRASKDAPSHPWHPCTGQGCR